MSMLKCTSAVVDHIERLKWDFLRHGKDDSKKFHLLKCNEDCKPKSIGGIGIRSLKEMNIAPQ